MTRRRGYDRGEFKCGDCPFTHTFATEAEYDTVVIHVAAHRLVSRLTPELREHVTQLLTGPTT